MEVLGWLLIPLAGLLLGLAWMVWRSRDPKPVDAAQGMEEMARFREAMEKPMPPLRRTGTGAGARRDGDPDAAQLAEPDGR
ncbi:MAG: hypothetical protein LCI03_01155 [Actinobacteria bacterium]|jgi:hypothetical protein|nr:hypothetical protein [Actinomycetota bacterium]